jgi:hypothetical protein
MMFRHHKDICIRDIFAGLSVRGVSVNTITVQCRSSAAVAVIACRGRPLPYFSCLSSTSGDVSRHVIDIWGGAQLVMDINPKG